MARTDDYAFNSMQAADPDKYITGGAMEHSEYEMDMNPAQQKEFMGENLRLFRKLYDADPMVNREKLPFSSYLKELDPELISMRADDFRERFSVGGSKKADWSKSDVPVLEISKHIDDLSKKHYGDVDRLRNMVLGR